LIRRIAERQESALAELYDATSERVFGLACRILSDASAAEDVTFEVYSQAWEQAHRFDPARGRPLAWLLNLSRSRAIDMLRKSRRLGVMEPLDSAFNIACDEPGPEEGAASHEEGRRVRAALHKLRPEQRRVIELAYFEGLSQSEIASKLGQPIGTVKTRMRSGMLALRKTLECFCGDAGTEGEQRLA
jgi:RNA polymerase sigma-70 factor (ECF subfamily)